MSADTGHLKVAHLSFGFEGRRTNDLAARAGRSILHELDDSAPRRLIATCKRDCRSTFA
jgi:hypothetical protein